MDKKTEALKLAQNWYDSGNENPDDFADMIKKVIALAEQPAQQPVAMRYDFDGYGYKYIDAGSGSDWQTRIKDAEPVYASPQPAQQQEPSMDYRVQMCPRQDCSSARKCTSFAACSTRAYIKPEQPTGKQFLQVKQPAQQEPVAWFRYETVYEYKNQLARCTKDCIGAFPLYTTPPHRKPLSDKELRVIENKINPNMRWRSSDEEGITLYPIEYYELVRAIEAAHGIKGEA